jgi:hypothetical protein
MATNRRPTWWATLAVARFVDLNAPFTLGHDIGDRVEQC